MSSTPTPKCRAYLLRHQLPTADPSTPIDPHAVVPCCFDPAVPPKQGGHKCSCIKRKWCQRHWCGGCKKANGVVHVVSPKQDGEVRRSLEGWKEAVNAGLLEGKQTQA